MNTILSFKLFESYSFFQSKQNKYLKLFQKLEEDGLSEEDAKELWNKIYGYRMAIKNQNREEKIQNAKDLEEVEDILTRVQLVSRATQWSKLIPSYLRNNVKGRIEEFADILVNYDEYDNFRTVFMKKVARYRNVDSFFEGLKNHIEGITDDYDEIIEKIESTDGIEVESVLPNQIIAWAYLYSASRTCGSQQWCISYSDNYWNSYVLNALNKQYFVWDFDHSSTDSQHQIGITVDPVSAKIEHAHFANDRDAKSYVKSQSWKKYLKPLSKEQKTKWILSLLKHDIKSTSYKTNIEILLEVGRTEDAKNLITSHAKDIKNDEEYSNNLFLNFENENNLDMIKFLIDDIQINSILFDSGKLFIRAYNNKHSEILDYLKSKVNEAQKRFIKNYVSLSNSENASKFYDILTGKI